MCNGTAADNRARRLIHINARPLLGAQAATMTQQPDYAPNAKAPEAGIYELRNIFGEPAGETVVVRQDERLPPAPRCFTWRLIPPATLP
jgi:hypothetical protein